MAVPLGQYLNLWDLAQRLKGDGSLGMIVETLVQRNAMLRGMVFEEATTAQYHQWHYRASYPDGKWINVNQGALPEKTGVTRAVERPGVLVMRSMVDDELLKQAPPGQQNQLRTDEDRGFIDAMGQQGVGTAIYGSYRTNPRMFDGFMTKLHSLSQKNVFHGGSTTASANSSILAIVWDREKGCTMFYPPNSTAGIFMQDLGMDTWDDPTTQESHEVWRTKFRLAWGMAIKDHRCVARYANIHTAPTNENREVFNPNIMIDILNFLWTKENAHFYCNRNVKAQIDKDALNKNNAYYTVEKIYGEPVMAFQGVPIELEEQLLTNEALVA